MTASHSRSPRTLPVLTIAGMVGAVAVPAVVGLVSALDRSELPGVVLLVPPALGVAGAVAAFFYRDIELGLRTVWALVSMVVGFAVPGLLWMLLVILYGP